MIRIKKSCYLKLKKFCLETDFTTDIDELKKFSLYCDIIHNFLFEHLYSFNTDFFIYATKVSIKCADKLIDKYCGIEPYNKLTELDIKSINIFNEAIYLLADYKENTDKYIFLYVIRKVTYLVLIACQTPNDMIKKLLSLKVIQNDDENIYNSGRFETWTTSY